MKKIRNKTTLLSLAIASGLAFSNITSAASINFNTDQAGNTYTGLSDSFISTEYNGVIINDSDPTAGSTYVNLTNSANSGTAINGYYINIGAFQNVQTQLTLDFTTSVTNVSFDFANPQGSLTVSAFDNGGSLLGNFNFSGTNTFLNQAGFTVNEGAASISGIGNIASLIIEPNFNEALIVDNLRFQPVPIPAALPLFTAGLLGLGLFKRRNSV